ncbi:MAG: hypothetical protein Q8Q88_09265, partial [Phenylobacterium sp.]|uniref:hypothetical protein n=1 Tax=Phenylobacterium sp. TaxID=1871053 RepID=UPI002733DE0B
MATVTVSDRESLLREIKAAQPGDTILLESGTYANVSLSDLKFVGDVTITSKDPGAPAVFTDLSIRDSSGLNFSNVEVVVDPARGS